MAGSIYGNQQNTKFMVKQYQKLDPDYEMFRIIQNSYEDLYVKNSNEDFQN